MRRLLAVAAALLLAPISAQAQSPDHDAAFAVVSKLFDGMRARDTASMRLAFVPTATLQSVSPTGVRSDAIGGWISSVATAPAGVVLDERLGTPIVQVSGDIATVWVDYWFYLGERFSHCGVDAFVLARQNGEWKILSVADTRRREGCAPAPAR